MLIFRDDTMDGRPGKTLVCLGGCIMYHGTAIWTSELDSDSFPFCYHFIGLLN